MKVLRLTASAGVILLAVFCVTYWVVTHRPRFLRHQEPGKCKKVLWWLATGGHHAKDYATFIKVAITSAKANAPSLVPHVIYDVPPKPDEFTRWVQAMGGVVHFHELSFMDRLMDIVRTGRKPPYWERGAGAFLRLDIPLLMANLTLDADEFETQWVLYTDADVMVLKDINSCSFRTPAILAAGSQVFRNKMENTGVLVMNVAGLMRHLPALINHGCKKEWPGAYEQETTLEFFKDRLDFLDDNFNWKVYWGPGDPSIIHFHGPKPLRCAECLIHATFTNLSAVRCDCPEIYLRLLGFAPDRGAFFGVMLIRWYAYLSAVLATPAADADLARRFVDPKLWLG